jgi:hypothetical protein
MFKKIINVLWTYSPQDYWVKLWSKTEVDEKVVAAMKKSLEHYQLTKAELADVARAIKEVGNQLGDVPGAITGKKRKGRKPKK